MFAEQLTDEEARMVRVKVQTLQHLADYVNLLRSSPPAGSAGRAGARIPSDQTQRASLAPE